MTVKGLEITKEDGICTIKFNQPEKKNSITQPMYHCIRELLNEVSNEDSIQVVVLTGVGDLYSSGTCLSLPTGGLDEHLLTIKQCVESFINFQKMLVCAVNGPAVGIAVTFLGLADFVYASEKATFHTPFSSLAICPEACSSYTFPKIMGYARANEMLIAGRKLTADEAFQRGLVTEVIPHHNFYHVVSEKVKMIASLPTQSVMTSKALIRLPEKLALLQANEEESIRLKERFSSEECINAIISFLSKSSKM